jgi:hypothetical protein
MTHAEDLDLWVRLFLHGGHVRYVDAVLGDYRVRGVSASRHLLKMIRGNMCVYDKIIAARPGSREAELALTLRTREEDRVAVEEAVAAVIAGDTDGPQGAANPSPPDAQPGLVARLRAVADLFRDSRATDARLAPEPPRDDGAFARIPRRLNADMSVRKAIAWASASKLLSFSIAFAGSIIVARYFLTPAEVGLFSIAFAATALIAVLQEFGLNRYIVGEAELGKEKLHTAFSVSLAVAWGVALVILAAAKPLSWLYGDPSSFR